MSSEPQTFGEHLHDRIARARDAVLNEGEPEFVGDPKALGALFGALAKATAQFKPVKKTAEVNFVANGRQVRYNYAPLANLTEATRDGLAANGLAVLQPFTLRKTPEGGLGTITTMLCHEGGARIQSRLEFTPQGDIKTLGGQTTYLGRYALCRLLMLDGIEDADSMEESVPHGAGGKAKGTDKPAPVSRPKPPEDAPKPSARAPKEQPPVADAPAASDPTPAPEEPRMVREENGEPSVEEPDAPASEDPPSSGPRTKGQEEAMRALAIKLKINGAVLGEYAQKLNKTPIAATNFVGASRIIEFMKWRLLNANAAPAAIELAMEKLACGDHLLPESE